MKIHVLLKKEELDGQRLPGKIVVVLDILFATSSIVAAVANGAQEVVPFLDGEAALGESRKRKAGSFVLSGELNAVTLEGFCHPTPLALIGEGLASKSVIYCTTNGTVAIAKSREASRVYAAALLNGEAMVEHVERTARGETVLLVCSGSADNFNLEDFYGAGYLVSLFARNPKHELSDAAIAAQLLHDRSDAYECLARSRVGRMMLDRGLESEVRFAARKSCFDVVVALEDGSLRAFR
ncbi:MAG: 2-phosphosulfolactate phosphatase [Deltaproteobacteria bacterium]|nr:MAG: 2-phosphosulfolactate phosphatase [Deltaproteobacteria bacterium]TMB34489.1 MAG: 2-phosphosulfolactate phosphatase [Deltaproteobacteria bacterium]